MNKITATKYVLAITLFTGAFNKPVLAASRPPDDKQIQEQQEAAFFKFIRKSYPTKKADSIISSQLDINAYSTDPDWTYFPMLTEAELDTIDHKEAIRIQGFELLEEFSPEEIEAMLKIAEADSSNKPLIHKNAQKGMAIAASAEVKATAPKEPKCQRSRRLKTILLCPQCQRPCSRLDSLHRHIQTQHFYAIPIATEAYAPIPKQQKSTQFSCKRCNATVNRCDCLNHIARTCTKSNTSTTGEDNEKKQ